MVTGPEGLDEGDDGGGFGFVAFDVGDLQRKPSLVGEETNYDLGTDTSFFRVPHPPESRYGPACVSSFSTSKYSVVMSCNSREISPDRVFHACWKHASAAWSR